MDAFTRVTVLGRSEGVFEVPLPRLLDHAASETKTLQQQRCQQKGKPRFQGFREASQWPVLAVPVFIQAWHTRRYAPALSRCSAVMQSQGRMTQV